MNKPLAIGSSSQPRAVEMHCKTHGTVWVEELKTNPRSEAEGTNLIRPWSQLLSPFDCVALTMLLHSFHTHVMLLPFKRNSMKLQFCMWETSRYSAAEGKTVMVQLLFPLDAGITTGITGGGTSTPRDLLTSLFALLVPLQLAAVQKLLYAEGPRIPAHPPVRCVRYPS